MFVCFCLVLFLFIFIYLFTLFYYFFGGGGGGGMPQKTNERDGGCATHPECVRYSPTSLKFLLKIVSPVLPASQEHPTICSIEMIDDFRKENFRWE